MNPLDFSQIKQFQGSVGGPLADMSINDFALLFNQASGSQAFNAGVGSGFENALKSFSAEKDFWIDENLGGVQDFFGSAGEGLFGLFGADRQAGRQAGEDSLSQFVDYLPMIAGGVLSPFTGGVSGGVGLAATMAMSGANALEKTDSTGQALFAAALPALGGPITKAGAGAAMSGLRGLSQTVPALASMGLKGGTKEVAKEVLENGVEITVERLLAKTFGDRVVSFAAGETAMNLTAMGGQAGVEFFETGQATNPFTKENLLSNLIDPTLVFGIQEVIQPSLLGSQVIDTNDLVRKFDSAATEEATKKVSQVEPTQLGKTYTEIEKNRYDALARAKTLPTKEDREQARAVIEDLYDFTLRYSKDLNEEQVGKLFGRNVFQAIEEAKTAPLSEQVIDANGEKVEKPILLQELVDTTQGKSAYEKALEEVTGWVAGPTRQQVVSDDALTRLIRASENKEPKTLEEIQQVVEDVNVVLDEVGEAPVDNIELQKVMEQQRQQGASVEEAAEAASIAVVNKARRTVEKAAKAAPDLRETAMKAGANVTDQAAFAEGVDLALASQLDTPELLRDELRAKGVIPSGMDEVTMFRRDGMMQGLRAVYAAKAEAQRQQQTTVETKKQQQAKAGAEKGGRPVAEAIDENDKASLEAISAYREASRGDELADAEFRKFDAMASALSAKSNQRPKAQQHLANRFAKYLKLKAEGKLVWKGELVETPEDHIAVLGSMLNTTLGSSGIAAKKWTRVKDEGNLNVRFANKEAAEVAIKARGESDVEYRPRKNTKGGWYVEWAPLENSKRNVGDNLFWDPKKDKKTVDEVIAVEAKDDSVEALLEKLQKLNPEANPTTMAALKAWAATNPEEAVAVLEMRIQDLQDEYAQKGRDVLVRDDDPVRGYELELDEDSGLYRGESREFDQGGVFFDMEAYHESFSDGVYDDQPGVYTVSDMAELKDTLQRYWGSSVGETLNRLSKSSDETTRNLAVEFLDMFKRAGRDPNQVLNMAKTAPGMAALPSEVLIGPNFIRNEINYKATETYFHEVGHILTAEKLRTSLAFSDEDQHQGPAYLQKLQEKANALLPEDPVRQLVDLYFEARKHYEQPDLFAGHAASIYRSHRNELKFLGKEYEISYGLMDIHEFLAMGINSRNFADFMRTVPVPANQQSFISRFVEAVKRLIGFGSSENAKKLDGTSHERLLQLFEQIATRSRDEDLQSLYRVVDAENPWEGGGLQINLPNEAPREPERLRVTSPKDMITRTLEKAGVAKETIEASHQTFSNLFDILGADDFESGLILSGHARGEATLSEGARVMLLGDQGLFGLKEQDKVRALSFVAGHELAHLVENLYNTGRLSTRQHQAFMKFQDWTTRADVNERLLALEIMAENLPKAYRNSEVVKAAMQATDAAEVRANLMSMWAMSQLHKPDSLAMTLLPRPVQKGLRVLTDLARKFYGAMKGVSYAMPSYRAKGEMRNRLDQMVKFAETLQRGHDAAEKFYTEGRGIVTVGPESWLPEGKLAMFGGDQLNVPDDPRKLGTKLFDNWILQFDQLTEMIPSFRPIAADMHNMIGHGKAMVNRTIGHMIGEVDASGKPQFESRESKLMYEKVSTNPKLNRLWSDWARRMQEGETNGIRGRALEFEELATVDPKLYNELKALNPKDLHAIDSMRKRTVHAMRKFSGEVLKVVEETNAAMVQSYVANRRPDLWKEAPGIGRMLYEAVKGLHSSNDPVAYELAQQNLSKVASLLSVDEVQRAVKLAEQGMQNYNKLSAEFIKNPHFLSEIRVGKHFIHYKAPNGKTGGEAYDDLQQVRERVRLLRSQGYKELRVEETRRGQAHAGNDTLFSLLEEHDERGRALINELDISSEAKTDLLSMFNTKAEFERSLAANQVVMQGSRRGLKPGRETLDMLATQIAYFQSASRSLQHRLLSHRLAYHYANPEFKNDRVMAYVPQLKQMISNYFVPDTETGTTIATLNAGYFLGMNLSSMLVEGAQPFFSYIPEMQSRGIGYVNSMRIVNQAQRAVAKFSSKHIPSVAKKTIGIWEGRDNNAFWDNPEYELLMKYAAEQDWISLTHASDVLESETGSNANLQSVVGRKGRKSESVLRRYGITPALNFARLGLKFYQQSTEFNARVALITGYEMAKQQGLTGQAALEEAGRFSRTVTFSGGKLNRPNAQFSGTGAAPRTIAQAMYSLQGYTYGMLSMMRRYAETAFSPKQYPGISPQDRKNARKALGTMITTQFLGAGALGMPFVGAAMAGLEAVSGIVFEKELRDSLKQMFDEDEKEDGGLLTSAVLHGAANALAGKVLPGAPDLSSRFSIGGVMGVNSYDGFSLSHLVGPTGAVIENVAKGAGAMVKGDLGETFESLAPQAWKKVISLYRDDNDFRDNGGGLLVDATFGEKFAHSIGFTPQKIAAFKNNERLQRRHEEALRQKDIRFHDQLSEMLREDPAKAQSALYQAALESPKVQMALQLGDQELAQRELMTAVKASATKVAERMEKREFARDPRREASMAGSLGTNFGQTPVSEMARLQHRVGTMQLLGVQPDLSERQVNRAQIIDQIMANYSFSRAEAAVLADRLLAQQ